MLTFTTRAAMTVFLVLLLLSLFLMLPFFLLTLLALLVFFDRFRVIRLSYRSWWALHRGHDHWLLQTLQL